MNYVQAMRARIGHERLLLVGAGVFVYRDDKVLLQKRRDSGCWADHGGCVELGERVEDAARRELREETGLIARGLTLLGVFSGEDMLHTYPNGDEASIVSILYVCDDFEGEPLPETDETLCLQWFDLDALPENISPPSRRPLAAFVEYVRSGGMARAISQ